MYQNLLGFTKKKKKNCVDTGLYQKSLQKITVHDCVMRD